MDSEKQLAYYSKRIVSLMSELEAVTGQMLYASRETSDLEKACWNAMDEKDLLRVKALHAKLCKIVDEVAK